jgi:serine/threonine-protein kinase
VVPPREPSRRFLAPGDKLGKHEVIREIAVGGMAALYLTRSVGPEGFERLACVKRILPEYARDPGFVAQFLDEARLAAALCHPNIAQVYECEPGGDPFFAMEYVHGEDLARLVETGREQGVAIPLDCALTLAAGLCAGLDHAHDQGIVHRDVSPGNVLVGLDGAVKLVDFGIARAVEPQQGVSHNGLRAKVAYMSPEQCRGRVALDRRSDVFSIGTILYELTTGQLPFVDDSEYGVLHQIINRDATPPTALVPDYPPALEAIVLRSLARDRDQRTATARELQHQLESFADASGLRVSSIVLARLMSTVFPARLEDWDTARKQGAFFVEQHVVRSLIESGKTTDSAPARAAAEEPVTAPSERTLVGSPPVAVAAPRTVRTPPAPSPTVGRGPRSTPAPGAPVGARPSSPAIGAPASVGARPSSPAIGAPGSVGARSSSPAIGAPGSAGARSSSPAIGAPGSALPNRVPTQKMSPAPMAPLEAPTQRAAPPPVVSPHELPTLSVPALDPSSLEGPTLRSPPPDMKSLEGPTRRSSPAPMVPANRPRTGPAGAPLPGLPPTPSGGRALRPAPIPGVPGAVPIIHATAGTLVSSTQAPAPIVMPLATPALAPPAMATGSIPPDAIPHSALGLVGIHGPGPSSSYPGAPGQPDPRMPPGFGPALRPSFAAPSDPGFPTHPPYAADAGFGHDPGFAPQARPASDAGFAYDASADAGFGPARPTSDAGFAYDASADACFGPHGRPTSDAGFAYDASADAGFGPASDAGFGPTSDAGFTYDAGFGPARPTSDAGFGYDAGHAPDEQQAAAKVAVGRSPRARSVYPESVPDGAEPAAQAPARVRAPAAARPTLIVRRQRPSRWPYLVLAVIAGVGVAGGAWLVLDLGHLPDLKPAAPASAPAPSAPSTAAPTAPAQRADDQPAAQPGEAPTAALPAEAPSTAAPTAPAQRADDQRAAQPGEAPSAAQPAEAAAQPAEAAAQPAQPAELAAQPAKPAAKPAEPAAQPGVPAAKPGEPAVRPGVRAAKPGEPAARPGEQSAKPAESAAKPAELAAKPAELAAKPATAKPGEPAAPEARDAKADKAPAKKPRPARIRAEKRPSRKAEPKEQPWNDDSPFLPVPTHR